MSFVYIASAEKGIVVCEFDNETGKLEVVQTVDTFSQGQFVRLHPAKSILYATGIQDKATEIFSFAITDGKLMLLNHEVTGGHDACHIAVDPENGYALTVNYEGADGRGSVAIFPLAADGQLATRSDFVQHEGSSVNRQRQAESHPHMIKPTPDFRYVLISDLGTDKVMVYQLDKGKLIPHSPDAIALEAGAGPRHFAFHPTKPYLYVINELNSTLNAFQYDADKGIWYDVAVISTLPDDADPKQQNYPADLHVHPSGRFLYGSNRGYNNIAIFKIDETSGQPELIGTHPTLGDWPRSFVLDSSGNFLLVGNQQSHSVVVLKVDAQSGMLSPTGHSIEIAAPVSIDMGD